MSGNAWIKSAAEMSEQDLRHVVWTLVQRMQVLEMYLAETVALVLFQAGEAEPRSEADLESTVEALTGYLQETNRHLQQMQRAVYEQN